MASNPAEKSVDCQIDPAFAAFLEASGGSVLMSTYQANKIVVAGWDGNRLSILLRDFDKPMGIAISGSTLAVGTRREIVFLENAAQLASTFKAEHQGKYDALFIPRVSYHTGDVAVHEVALGSSGELWFANTRFSCISRLSSRYSFEPVWKPKFVSEIAPEDRCHLNGLALAEGRPAYATCLGQSDVPGGWRDGRANGGCVIDIASDEVISGGLAMPHSPRWHEGRLWVLNSGAGELISIDGRSGQSTVVATLPAYLRGLDFAGKYALVGMSTIREAHTFGGLPVQKRFGKLLSGVAAIDLRSGNVEGMMQFTRGISELFEVRFLPGIRRPMVLNREREESGHAFTSPGLSFWVRPKGEGKT